MALLTKCRKAPWSQKVCIFSNYLNSPRLSQCRNIEDNSVTEVSFVIVV